MVLTRFSLRRLLVASLKIGATGFGGGSALIPIMEREYVQRYQLLDQEMFTAHTVVANVTPGALPVKLAALAGTQDRRIWASMAAALCVALPGTLATVLLLALFTAIGPAAIRVVEFAAVGISVFIMVLLLNYISKVLRSSALLPAATFMVLSFLATGANQLVRAVGTLVGTGWTAELPQLSAVQLVLAALAGTGIYSLLPPGRRIVGEAKQITPGHTLAPAALFAAVSAGVLGLGFTLGYGRFLSLIGLSTVASFGGGAGYVGVADGFFVADGTVSAAEFYGQSVPIANALPGPILVKIAAALGYSYGTSAGGWAMGALVAALVCVLSVAACCAVALIFMAGYDKLADRPFVRNLGKVILPVICGLLLSTSLAMLNASMAIAAEAHVSAAGVGWASLAGIGVLWPLHRRGKVPDLVLLAASGMLSLVALLLLA